MMTKDSTPIAIDAGSDVRRVTFTANGKYLVSGGLNGIQVWQAKDGEIKKKMEARDVKCLAVSGDTKWIAAGTSRGLIIAWDAERYQEVFSQGEGTPGVIHGIDFSPDSTRLVSASSNHTVVVWDMARRERVQTLNYEKAVRAAKYSPQGDRIATATDESVQVWDSNSGFKLFEIPVKVVPEYNTGLAWLHNHLFVLSDNKVKQFDACNGSVVSEWPVLDINRFSCITLPKHGKFVAYSTKGTVTFRDASALTQLVIHPQDTFSIAVSPDDQDVAFCGPGGKITIKSLSTIKIPIPLSRLYPTLQEPDIQINDDALSLWERGELQTADTLLTTAISEAHSPSSHALASRALVRVHLRQWDAAMADAKKALEVQPSVIGYIAKGVAHVSKGERHDGYRLCDIACQRFHLSHVSFLMLVKAILMFMAGERRDAISRVDDLIATVPHNSICYVVQAYMYFRLGNTQMESEDYEDAIQSFERAQAQMQHPVSGSLSVVSLISGWKFNGLSFKIGQQLCKALWEAGRIRDAVECSRQMTSEMGETGREDTKWVLNFKHRSLKELERLGDAAMNVQEYDKAISHYTTALSLNHSQQSTLIKRSKVYMSARLWKQALDDANQFIALDPSSPRGYEMKHAALHKIGDYDGAVDAFETMFSRMEESLESNVQQYDNQFINPLKTRATIRKIVHRTIRHSPHVLINTADGRLSDRAQQVSAFEAQPVFKELLSSTTTRIDYDRIKREVRHYFRYVMLSHVWQKNEPLFGQVVHIAVYDLGESPTHDKLRTFCEISRDAGFNWAWSDTCCINKSDQSVLQKALVAMFKWYKGSTMVIVFLHDVSSTSQRVTLANCAWNTRAWTLQEYLAPKTIRFYTEDWKPYLDLTLPNHKESPEVISEMERATRLSAEKLIALRPGPSNIREKLRLASTRQSTEVEDAAYSLLGIFSVSGFPVIYGEEDATLGRLLARVLAISGDVSILAWTGDSGTFNSCFPARISVFTESATSHIPPPNRDSETEGISTVSDTPSIDLDVVLKLYDCLYGLPAPWFSASRMKLPCIAFQLPRFSLDRTRSGRVYRVDTLAFGKVEVKTKKDLSRMSSLYLIHPWLGALLGREDTATDTFVEDDVTPPSSPSTEVAIISDEEEIDDDALAFHEPDLSSHLIPAHGTPMNKEMEARKLVARLKQPFGALLVALAATGRPGMDYRRVAANSLITVQFQKNVSLAHILENVRILDIL